MFSPVKRKEPGKAIIMSNFVQDTKASALEKHKSLYGRKIDEGAVPGNYLHTANHTEIVGESYTQSMNEPLFTRCLQVSGHHFCHLECIQDSFLVLDSTETNICNVYFSRIHEVEGIKADLSADEHAEQRYSTRNDYRDLIK